MKYKTKGIVLNHIRFRETSIIATVYTELFGLKSYIINNVRSSKPRFPAGFFQPMNQLELVVYNKEHASLNRVAEIHGANIYSTIPFDIYKTTMVLFITEILHKILREEEPNPELYQFMGQSMSILDKMQKAYFNFHVQFLLKLTRFFGIKPAGLDEMTEQILENELNFTIPDKGFEQVRILLDQPMGEVVTIDNELRRKLIEVIILYYKSHFDQLHVIKSYAILKEVFEG